MRKWKIWLLSALALIALGGVIFVITMSINGWDFKKLGGQKFTTKTFEVQEEFENISVDAITTDVTFAAATDGKCKIVAYEGEKRPCSVSVAEGTLTVNRLAEFNDPELSRLFYIGRIYHTEEIGQLQFMLRYNVLSREYEKYAGVGEFVFELVTEADGEEVARYTEYYYITDQALMYRYFRIAFENVDLTNIDGAYVIIYYQNGEKNDIGHCIVYDKDGAAEKFDPGKGSKPSGEMKHEE
jgi:hypothetical protein